MKKKWRKSKTPTHEKRPSVTGRCQGKISDPEDMYAKRKKKSLKTPTRQNIQELWDCFNGHNVCVVGKPEREERMEKKKSIRSNNGQEIAFTEDLLLCWGLGPCLVPASHQCDCTQALPGPSLSPQFPVGPPGPGGRSSPRCCPAPGLPDSRVSPVIPSLQGSHVTSGASSLILCSQGLPLLPPAAAYVAPAFYTSGRQRDRVTGR